MQPNNWYSIRGFHNYSRWNTNRNSYPPPHSLTILRYNAAPPVTSFMWDTVNFTLDTTLPNYSYTSSTTSIPPSQVPGFTALIQVTIGNSVTSIGDSAFDSCSQLQSITIPNSVTSIGVAAFPGCTALTSVTFTPTSTLQSIGNYAFEGCSQLQSITIPNSVTSIGPNAFQFSGLTSVTIPTATATALGITGTPTPINFFGANNVNMNYLP